MEIFLKAEKKTVEISKVKMTQKYIFSYEYLSTSNKRLPNFSEIIFTKKTQRDDVKQNPNMNVWGFHALSVYHLHDLCQMLRIHREKWNHFYTQKVSIWGSLSSFLHQSDFPWLEQAEEQSYPSNRQGRKHGQALLKWNNKVQYHK